MILKFTFEEWALIRYNMEIAVMEHERNMQRCAVSDKPRSPYQIAKGEMEKIQRLIDKLNRTEI